MSDKEFVDGLIVRPPHEKAPDFVKARISIKRKDLGNWLRQRDDDWINLDIKEGRSGKWFAEVNNWKPGELRQETDAKRREDAMDAAQEMELDDDIPFS